MKIDESCINHNAMRLTSEIVSMMYDCIDRTENDDNSRLVALGEISGIIRLAEVLKEALRT